MRTTWIAKKDAEKRRRKPETLARVVLTDEDVNSYTIGILEPGVQPEDFYTAPVKGNLKEMERLHVALGRAIAWGKKLQEQELLRARAARMKASGKEKHSLTGRKRAPRATSARQGSRKKGSTIVLLGLDSAVAGVHNGEGLVVRQHHGRGGHRAR